MVGRFSAKRLRPTSASNIPNTKQYRLATLVIFLLVSSSGYAEIFKWVDEEGRTHYSDKKLDIGKAIVESLEVKPSLNLMPALSSPNPSPKEELELSQRKLQSPVEPQKAALAVPKEREEKKRADVDPRCTLANKIISGEARLSNGEPTGKHEMEVAKRDISKFCK